MARIPMTGGFQRIPEGVHVLKITKAEHDEEFGKLTFTLENAKGQSCQERFNLLNLDNTTNEKAMSAFSFFAKTAMNNFEMVDVDPVELVGRYIRAEVIHNTVESKKEAGKMMVFVNLGEKTPADGFDGVPAAAPKAPGLDLNALLGN